MTGFTLKGWHVLAVLIGFFGVVFTVNGIFIAQAMSTFRGEEASRAYVRSMAYNDIIARRAEQAALGWTASVNVEDGMLILAVVDADEAPVNGLALQGLLRHPADVGRDLPLNFTADGSGRYTARLDPQLQGSWRFSAWTPGEPPFEVSRRLWLS